MVVGGERPVGPAVVRAVQPLAVQQVHALRMGAVRDRGRAGHFGQPVALEFGPGQAFVGGLVQVRRPGVLEQRIPGGAGRVVGLRHGGEYHARVVGRPRQIGGARLRADIQHPLPAAAAVAAAIDPARAAFVVVHAARGRQQQVGIVRIHQQPRDRAGIFQTRAVPVGTGVGRFPDAAAVLDAEDAAGARIDDRCLRRRHRQRGDPADRVLSIGQRTPGDAGIFRLPDAAVVGADVADGRLPLRPRHGVHLAGDERPDVAPLHALQQLRTDLRLRRRGDQQCADDGRSATDDARCRRCGRAVMSRARRADCGTRNPGLAGGRWNKALRRIGSGHGFSPVKGIERGCAPGSVSKSRLPGLQTRPS